MKKLAVAVMLGIGVMVSGCGNNDVQVNNVQTQQVQTQQVQTQQVQQVITLNNNTIDKPDLRVGDKVTFNGVRPKLQIVTTVNGRQILNETYGGKHGVTMYSVDITDIPKGKKAVLIVDNVMTMIDDAQNHKLAGYYTGKDDKVVVTTVVGHAKVE